MNAFRPCALVPVFNHAVRLPAVATALRAHGLPLLLIDDGSTDQSAALITRLASEPGSHAVRHPRNLGKGAAIASGLRYALEQRYTHALQVDADGQHDLRDVPKLLAAAKAQPAALITGQAVFDSQVPRLRLRARYLTHFWVWVNTLSLRIPDSMCGFRVYPVAQTCRLLERHRLGPRMSFDTEIMVRHFWSGGEVVSLPTAVSYPADGVSHFRMLEDNLRLSGMHARLFLGMLVRAPWLLWRNWRRPPISAFTPPLEPRP